MVYQRLRPFFVFACICINAKLNIAAQECGGNPADVVFVLDASTSIWGPDYTKQLQFVQDVIGEFNIRPTKTRCGLVTFSDYVRVEFNLETYTEAKPMMYAVGHTRQLLGNTRTDLALERAREMFYSEHRKGVPKLAIVLTDGESEDVLLTAEVAEMMAEDDIVVFAVGIGKAVNKEELRSIASAEQFVFEVDSYDALQSIRKMLAIKACEVEEGYQGDVQPATPPTKGCDGKPADVVFALDASASIWQNDFEKQLQFVKDMVNIFEVSPEMTRIGILTFGDNAERQFYQHKYTDPNKLVHAIGKVRQNHGNTNTAAALYTMRKQFFSTKRSRNGVVHIGIVITDGQSDDPSATAMEAARAREDGIHLFAVGVGRNVDQKELYNIASQPAGQYVFEVTNYEALGSIKNLLAMKTCEVTEPPTTPKPTTTTTTLPPPTGCSAQLPADIVFALPAFASGVESKHVLRFIRSVTRKLDLDSDAVRLGLLPKHCYTVPGFTLSEGSDQESVISLISSSKSAGMKHSKSIIQHMCEISFQSTEGSRANAKKIGVVFVDMEKDPDELLKTAEEAAQAKSNYDVEVIIVGVGRSVSENDLSTRMGADMEKRVVLIPNYDELRNLAGALTRRFDELCLELPDFQLYHL